MSGDLPDVKLRGQVNFPARVTGRTATAVTKVNGQWFIDHDVSGLVQNPTISAGQVAQSWMTIWNSVTNSYQNVPYALAATSGVSSLHGQTGALDIGSGLEFTGTTLDQNLGDQINQYNTVTNAVSAIIPPSVNGVRTFGRGVLGDCQPIFWTRLLSAPVTPRTWHFQNLHDLSWWALTVGCFVSPAMFAATAINSGIQDALDYLQTFGLTGGRVTCEPNKIYTGTVAPKVWNGLTLDCNGSKISTTMSGSGCYGIRVGDNAEVCNGWAESIDAGITESQFCFGSAITLGVCNGSPGNLIGTPDYFASCRPRVRNMTVSTSRLHCPAIQIMGDVDFLIENIKIPDSTTCSGIHADWSDIGGITVAGGFSTDLGRLTNWRAAFNAGTMITTHPRGTIRNVRAGKLTVAESGDSSSRVVRLSACRDVIVSDCSILECTGPAVEHVGGDLGFEFAPIDVQRRAYCGMRFTNITSALGHNLGMYFDTWPDNLDNAVTAGYVPRSPVSPSMIAYGDIIATGLSTVGPNDGTANDGIRIARARGVTLISPRATGHAVGLSIEDLTENLVIDGGIFFANRSHGLSVKAVSTIKNVLFDGVDSRGNGTATALCAGFRIDGGTGIVIDRCFIGDDAEATQSYAVFIDAGASRRGVTVIRPTIRNVKSGGIVMVIGAGGTDVLEIMEEPIYGGTDTFLSGQTIIPVERLRLGASVITRYTSVAASMSGGVTPASGPIYVQGDTVEVPDAASGSAAISRRGTSTWAALVLAP
jgi:hypothetical protein